MNSGDERRTDELTCSEQFVLWTARSWVAAFKHRQPVYPHLRQGFEVAGIPDGLFALDELMGLLASAARRPLDFRCVKCRKIGADEALLLRCLAAGQSGRAPEIDRVLMDWLPPAAARMALRPVMILAMLLDSIGMRVPMADPVPSVPWHHADDRLMPCADPGLHRLQ
jgi:hypothetical protein